MQYMRQDLLSGSARRASAALCGVQMGCHHFSFIKLGLSQRKSAVAVVYPCACGRAYVCVCVYKSAAVPVYVCVCLSLCHTLFDQSWKKITM